VAPLVGVSGPRARACAAYNPILKNLPEVVLNG
jgi:hypothetical protein